MKSLITMDTTELILKFGWLGWTGDLEDIDSLLDWLYKDYGIDIEEGLRSLGSFTLVFQRFAIRDFFGISGKDDIIKRILPEILKLWKCEGGELMGPSLENYDEPNTYWT